MSRKKTIALQVVALVAVFSVFFFVGKVVAEWGKPSNDIVTQEDKNNNGTNENELPVNRLNVLLLGIDARPGEKDARTDSMILVSIDRDTQKIAMISIPRDTLVDIEGHGSNKINSANQFGGADLARKTVEQLLGVNIPYYVKTNFDGFKDIVDTLGGVTLDVEKRMYYPSENINLKPGEQRLNGSNALAYVRFRHDALGDIARTQRQQKFLTALAKEAMKASTIIKLPKLVPQLMAAVETNLGLRDAIFLASAASRLDPGNIVSATLPGVFYNYKGVSYWKVDTDKTKVVLNELLNGVKVAAISGPDVNVPKDTLKTIGKIKTKTTQNTGEWKQKNNARQPKQNNWQNSGNNNGQYNGGSKTNNTSGGKLPSTNASTGNSQQKSNSNNQNNNHGTNAGVPSDNENNSVPQNPGTSDAGSQKSNNGGVAPGNPSSGTGNSAGMINTPSKTDNNMLSGGNTSTTSSTTKPKVNIVIQG